MLTVGSVSREDAARVFPFLSARFRGRRAAIKELTHRDPEFVFWIHPEGLLHDARDAHRRHPPRGFEHIIDDPPDYGGFLRGRLASDDGQQIVVVYCRAEALASPGPSLSQLLIGLRQLPVPLGDHQIRLELDMGVASVQPGEDARAAMESARTDLDATTAMEAQERQQNAELAAV